MLSADEMRGVDATLDGLNEAWNRNDIDAYGALLTEDCEWVNVVGMYWPNRASVMKALRVYHATMFKGVKVREVERKVSAVVKGVVCGVATFDLDEYMTPDGRRMVGVRDRLTYILVEREGKWLVRSGHNTTIDARAAPHDPGK